MFAGTGGTFTGNPVRGTVYYQESPDFPPYEHLTFSSADTFTVTPPWKVWAGTIEYSTDATNWSVFNATGAVAADDGSGTYKLHLRGTGNTRISPAVASTPGWTLTAAGAVACSGNIETLLDYTTAPAHTSSTSEGRATPHFARRREHARLDAHRRRGSRLLRQHRDPARLHGGVRRPAPAMDYFCFANLFQGWTALTEAPTLSATNLVGYCYRGMFQGCTGLTNAPALPATASAVQCYYYMFQGCTGLTQPPALPATTLPNYCYGYMFQGCTGIKLSTTGPGAEWGIPAGATPANSWNTFMLADTGGTFTGDPEIGAIYYCTSAPGPGPDPDPEAPIITAITVDTSASTLEITIDNAITGAWYTLLVADELGDPWAVSPAVQATADGILVFQNVPATLPRRFYKVRASATQPQP